MRDYEKEYKARVKFIKKLLKSSGASGIIFGNSGGKDSALVGILCKAACDNTLGLIMPCNSRRNYGEDMQDAGEVARQFGIAVRVVDLTAAREAIIAATDNDNLSAGALANIAPRLRMTALYTVGAAENRLVAGTGNRSEAYMGYFTKWGDGAHDFNPISDLTATEVFEFLRWLKAPQSVIDKAPSAGLFDGQTDEQDMGVTYAAIDGFLTTGKATPEEKAVIRRYHTASEHKRRPIAVFKKVNNRGI